MQYHLNGYKAGDPSIADRAQPVDESQLAGTSITDPSIPAYAYSKMHPCLLENQSSYSTVR